MQGQLAKSDACWVINDPEPSTRKSGLHPALDMNPHPAFRCIDRVVLSDVRFQGRNDRMEIVLNGT